MMYTVRTFYRDQVSALIDRTDTFQHAQQIAATRMVRDETCSDAVITDENDIVLDHTMRRWNDAGVEQPMYGYTRTLRLMREQLEIAASR